MNPIDQNLYQNTGSTWRRLGALTMDGLLAQLVFYLTNANADRDPYQDVTYPWLSVTFYGLSVLAWISYTGILLAVFGGTPGKLLLGLRVVGHEKSNHIKLSWPKAWLRAILSTSSSILFFMIPVSAAVMLFRKDRRQLADLIAGTQVTQKAKRAKEPKPRWIVGSLLIILALFGLNAGFKLIRLISITNEGVLFRMSELNKPAQTNE
jgi:uncharacterized RDD family membrane protein YckC